jgi:hypothetical protein
MMTTLKSNSVSNTMATRNGVPTTASVYVIVIANVITRVRVFVIKMPRRYGLIVYLPRICRYSLKNKKHAKRPFRNWNVRRSAHRATPSREDRGPHPTCPDRATAARCSSASAVPRTLPAARHKAGLDEAESGVSHWDHAASAIFPAAARPRSISAMMSSICSMPTERRT